MGQIFERLRGNFVRFVRQFPLFTSQKSLHISNRKPILIQNLLFTAQNHFKAKSDTADKMPGKNKEVLKFKRLSPYATAPSKGSQMAAGYDLHSADDILIKSMTQGICKTDLQIAIPEGCYGRVAPRSGLAVKHSIHVGAGVVDADYRGNICVILFNLGKEDFVVKRGDRIAQLICERVSYPELEEVDSLDETTRGEAGFGSTGR